MSLSAWYVNQYGNALSGTARLRVSPFMPSNNDFDRTRAAASRAMDAYYGGAPQFRGQFDAAAFQSAAVAYNATGLPMTTAEMVAAVTNQTNGMDASGQSQAPGKGRKKGEMLFGPDIGDELDAEKGWTTHAQPLEPGFENLSFNANNNQQQGGGGGGGPEIEVVVGAPTNQAQGRSESKVPLKSVNGKELGKTVPLQVVREWVDRVKKEEGGIHKTTTLQALVNVKRPTIQLLPLKPSNPAERPVNDDSMVQGHIIKFTYDASTPRVRITLTLHDLPTDFPSANNRGLAVVHTGIYEGGFGKAFALPEADALKLAPIADALEERSRRMRASMESEGSDNDDKDDLKAAAQVPPAVSYETQAQPTQPTEPNSTNNSTSRFRLFGRRNRDRQDEEARIGVPEGDAVEMQNTSTAATQATQAAVPAPTAIDQAELQRRQEEELGIKAIITIEGCDENGSAVEIKNAQSTHFLVSGRAAGSGAENSDEIEAAAPRNSTDGANRQWMLRVVRREARIGSHIFLLREIFGLSSATSNEPTATSQVTYPPTAEAADDPYASAPNECIVCLSAPRDVVLLPCRHLVVCRDCAVGMIEFGAGGKVARRDEGTNEAGANQETNNANGETNGAAATEGNTNANDGVVGAAIAPLAPTRERRRKKAKGWFCPVCRQPYTSLLRLAVPSAVEEEGVAGAAASVHSLSRAPSRVGGASLHRVSSHATLPERGERMLREAMPDEDEVDGAAAHTGETTAVQESRPQFIISDEAGESAEARSQTATGSEDAAAAVTERKSTERPNGWKEV